MNRPKVEILAPAGSYESMTAAISAGADAVYIGGSRFGARAYADNLDEERMLEAIDHAHLHGCRLYMTVNTLMKDKEMDQLFDYMDPYYRQGLDAAIVQDPGVFAFLKKHFPGLHLHGSTQMTVTGVYGARLLKEAGASRVVMAREVSLEEIRKIKEQVDIEIEAFVHGALCYCYSGQCLLSSVIGGRSGNRGRCAQPCRLPYEAIRDGKDIGKKNERYIMSLKDLCTLDLIPDMIEAGIYSMKIEGRMKSPRYTAGVVSMYRKYTDMYLRNGREGYSVDPADKQMLLELFDRGGFTDGYYKKHNGRDMVALHEKPQFREVDKDLLDHLDEAYVKNPGQVEISGKAAVKAGEASSLTLSCGQTTVTVYGQATETAKNQPMTEEKVLRQIGKTGGSDFVFRELSARTEGDPFIPVQALNELRRTGFQALREEILKPWKRGEGIRPSEKEEKKEKEADPAGGRLKITASAEDAKTAECLAAVEGISRICLDSAVIGANEWKRLAAICHEQDKECWLIMPRIFRTEAERYFLEHKQELEEAGFDGLLLGSLEETGFLKDQDVKLPIAFDSGIYVFNKEGEQALKGLGARFLTLPAELNGRELQELGCGGKEMVVYGRLPLMVSAQCIQRTADRCSRRPGILSVRDRMGKEFPVRNVCRFCYNVIYNTSPLSLHGMEEMVRRLGPASVRLAFTTETKEEAQEIARAFVRGFGEGQETLFPGRDFTRGHFKRGVE